MSNYPAGHVEPAIAKIPAFGTSWFDRGTRYWVKRVFLALVLALLLAGATGFGLAFAAGLSSGISGSARSIFWSIFVVVIVGSHLLGFRSVRRRRERQGSAATSGTAGVGVGVSALGGSVVAGAFIGFGAIIGLGWFTALFFYSLTRYASPFEVQAVEEMRRWYQDHPDIPNEERPNQFRT